MQSNSPVSVTWHDGISRTVFAWANHNREATPGAKENHEILVAIGYTSNDVMATPVEFNYKAAAGPAVACKYGNPGSSYDCIMAWVDWNDPDFRVRSTRFSTSSNSVRYSAAFENGPVSYQVGYSDRQSTANRIAAWYTSDKFWIAFRAMDEDQHCLAYSSSNGISWTEVSDIGECTDGPTAIGYHTGVNAGIGYVK